MRRRTYAGAAVLLLLTMSLSGCVFWADEESPTPIEDSPYTSIWERHTLEWQMDDSMSFLLNPGKHVLNRILTHNHVLEEMPLSSILRAPLLLQ